MPISLRVALMSASALLVAAASQVPTSALADTLPGQTPQELQLAVFSPAPVLPTTIDSNDAADASVVMPEDEVKPEPGTLRELVRSIAALPSTELSEDVRCLATAVYFESKGEPIEGQLAVAQVILNRVESGRFASSVCGVVRQPGQFTFAYRSPASGTDWRVAQAVAVVAATRNWHEVAPDATYFHAKRVAPGWSGMKRVSAIGNHIFYARR